MIKVGKLRAVNMIAEKLKNQKTKVGYAALKAVENISAVLKEKNKAVEDKRYELAMTGEKGEMLFEENGSMKFTKENYKLLEKFIETQNEEEVEYEPYFATDISSIEDSPALLDALNGVIVNVNIEDFYNEKTKEEK